MARPVWFKRIFNHTTPARDRRTTHKPEYTSSVESCLRWIRNSLIHARGNLGVHAEEDVMVPFLAVVTVVAVAVVVVSVVPVVVLSPVPTVAVPVVASRRRRRCYCLLPPEPHVPHASPTDLRWLPVVATDRANSIEPSLTPLAKTSHMELRAGPRGRLTPLGVHLGHVPARAPPCGCL
jgi:hypothetical protein